MRRQIARAMALVRRGRYRTLSDLIREAVDEKLARLDEELLEDEVARYCAAGHGDEDLDLVRRQSFEPATKQRPVTKKTRRAAR